MIPTPSSTDESSDYNDGKSEHYWCEQVSHSNDKGGLVLSTAQSRAICTVRHQ